MAINILNIIETGTCMNPLFIKFLTFTERLFDKFGKCFVCWNKSNISLAQIIQHVLLKSELDKMKTKSELTETLAFAKAKTEAAKVTATLKLPCVTTKTTNTAYNETVCGVRDTDLSRPD